MDRLRGFAFDEGQTTTGITLKPGESASATGSYTVTENDVNNGQVVNEATATGSDPEDPGITPGVTPGRDPEPTDKPTPSLFVDKAIANPQATYRIGDTINYTIRVVNNGNTTLTNVAVSDQLGSGAAGTVAITDSAGGAVSGGTFTSMAPGDSRTIRAAYTVVRADAGKRVSNTVVATTDDPTVNPMDETQSNPVESLYTLTINYVYQNGNQAAAPYVAQLTAGEAYRVVSPAVTGFTANYALLTGNMPAQDTTVNVEYTANAPAPAPAPTPTPTPAPTPNRGGGGGAAAPAAAPAAAAAAAPAAPAANPVNPLVGPVAGTIVIDDNGTPRVETIADDGTALASGVQGSWSLFDLICTIVAALLAIIMLIFAFGRKRDEEDDNDPDGTNAANRTMGASDGGEDDPETAEYKRRRAGRIAGLVPGIGSVILLFLTQNFTQQMVIFDQWSVLFGILALVNIVLAIATRTKKDDENNEDGQQPAGYAPTTV